MSGIRVLLVDDEPLLREGLRRLLEIEVGIDVVGEAADGVRALDLVPLCRPDVALVDARMPGMDGVVLIGQLACRHPDVAAVMLTTFDEDAYILGALRGGARGYLLKDIAPAELVAAIRRVHQGGTVLGDPAAALVVSELRRQEPVATAAPLEWRAAGEEPLSAREVEVAALVATGFSNLEIASQLCLAHGTVKNHISSALRKLKLRDRTQLALQLRRAGSPYPASGAGEPEADHM